MNQIRDYSRGLTITNNSNHPDHQIDVAVKEIILEDNNRNPLYARDAAVTVDITRNGVNGLDAGSEAPDTWYYVWLIAKSSGPATGLLSLSSQTPALPAGYLFKAFLGAVHNSGGGGSDFAPFHQTGRVVARNAVAVLNGGNATTPTAISCFYALPEKAVKAIGDVTLNLGPGGGRGEGWIRSRPDEGVVGFAGYLNTQDYLTFPFSLPIVESQQLYYNRSGLGNSNVAGITISISGFEY